MRYTKSKLENLPNPLHELSCSWNWITKLENLPNGLEYIFYDIGKITMVDNLSIDWFREGNRKGFSLDFYNTIKRLQRRHRIRYRLKNKAARIIQNGCHDWVWKPILKDGKNGIYVRLSLKALGIKSEL